ncbi:hypothetical protein [Oenococcus sicerae]|nr:hypothetical protein [Oenococcus sicerae]
MYSKPGAFDMEKIMHEEDRFLPEIVLQVIKLPGVSDSISF